jgi:lipopolysaccharide export LptBFGC system permease protein LptF
MYGRLALAVLAVAAVVAVTETLSKTSDLYRLVFAGVISVRELLIVCGSLLPIVFYHLSPEMVSIALLARYYLWRQRNEVLTLRTMGLSCSQIARPGIAAGVCAGLFSAAMSLYVLPATFGKALDIRSAAATRIAPRMLQESVPNAILPKVSLSFRRWLSADVIEDVVLTQDHEPGDFTLITADRGAFVETKGVYALVLESGAQVVHHSAEDTRRVAFERLSIPLTTPQPPANQIHGYYEESIGHLLNPPAFVRKDPGQLAAWLVEGHHRIVNPLRCVSCALLLLGVLVPGLQGYAELLVRLGLAVALLFAENSAATIAFIVAHRHAEAAPLLYLLPLTSGGIGTLLLVTGDRHISRWLRLPKLRRGKPRRVEANAYAAGVALAGRVFLELAAAPAKLRAAVRKSHRLVAR